MMGDVYVEIGPQDADYARLAAQALTPEEAERRRDQWRQDDEALRQEFLEFARLNGESAWTDPADDEQLLHWLAAARPRDGGTEAVAGGPADLHHLDVLRQLEGDSTYHRAALRRMDHANLEVGVSDDSVEDCLVGLPVAANDRSVEVSVLALRAAGQRGNPEHDAHKPVAAPDGNELVRALSRVDDLDQSHL